MPPKRGSKKKKAEVKNDLERLADLVADKLKDELLVDKLAGEIIESTNRDKMMQYINSRTFGLREALADTQEWLRSLLLEVKILQDLLREKAGISPEQIDCLKRQKSLELFLQEKFWSGLNVHVNRDNGDKIVGEQIVDCAERYQYCGGACCFIGFALTPSEVEQGLIRWDEEHPFDIAHTKEGICTHWKARTKKCGIYENRPIVCRQYSCENDRRIWLNYEDKIINPKLRRRLKRVRAKSESKVSRSR